jgi:small subunit ribosomal protein S21
MRRNNPTKKGTSVEVKDGNFSVALRKLKKKLDESNKLIDVLDRQHYTKPTTERKKKAGAAKARWQKKLRDESLPKKMY